MIVNDGAQSRPDRITISINGETIMTTRIDNRGIDHRDAPLHVLRIDASARGSASTSRALADRVIEAVGEANGAVEVVRRDVAAGLPFVHEDWVAASYTPEEQRTDSQRAELALSDALVAEVKSADLLVIGVPVYNFQVPAALKAWIDLVARAQETFRYTDNGPEGLVKDTKAILALASGGVTVGGDNDFVTPYLRYMLGFLGINDVEIVAAEAQNVVGERAVEIARQRIATLARHPFASERRAA